MFCAIAIMIAAFAVVLFILDCMEVLFWFFPYAMRAKYAAINSNLLIYSFAFVLFQCPQVESFSNDAPYRHIWKFLTS